MLSWASYLFGGGSSAEPQQDDNKAQEETTMDTTPTSEKDWVVIEHSGDNEVPQVGITDLENLLIEHPSMSVYKRSGSSGEDSNLSDSSDELVSSKRSQAVSRQAPKRVRTVSARAQLLAQVSQVKHAQKVQQKHAAKSSGRRNLTRSNKVATLEKNVSKKNRVRNPSGRMNGRMPQRKF